MLFPLLCVACNTIMDALCKEGENIYLFSSPCIVHLWWYFRLTLDSLFGARGGALSLWAWGNKTNEKWIHGGLIGTNSPLWPGWRLSWARFLIHFLYHFLHNSIKPIQTDSLSSLYISFLLFYICRIYVDLPDAQNRMKILRIFLSKENLNSNFNYEELGNATEGYSGSDLKVLHNS